MFVFDVGLVCEGDFDFVWVGLVFGVEFVCFEDGGDVEVCVGG